MLQEVLLFYINASPIFHHSSASNCSPETGALTYVRAVKVIAMTVTQNILPLLVTLFHQHSFFFFWSSLCLCNRAGFLSYIQCHAFTHLNCIPIRTVHLYTYLSSYKGFYTHHRLASLQYTLQSFVQILLDLYSINLSA